MDLKKLKSTSIASKLPEVGVYLVKKLEAVKEDLEKLIYLRTRQIVVACNYHTTTGGSVTEEIPVVKACGNKKVLVSMVETGATPVSIVSAKCQIGKVIVTFSADPGPDHKISYLIIE